MQAEEDSLPFDKIIEILNELERAVQEYEIEKVVKLLSTYVSGYSANTELKDYIIVDNNSRLSDKNTDNEGNVVKIIDKFVSKDSPN